MKNPINDVPFGQEHTAKHHLERAEWEYDQAARLRVQKHPVGYTHLALGHEDTARAYEKRARELEAAGPPKPPTATARVAKSTTKKAKSAGPPSWKQIAEDYKRRAKAAKAAGGRVKRTPDGSILIVPTEGSDEYFYQDWEADQLIEETKRREKEVLEYISLEDLLLAQSQNW